MRNEVIDKYKGLLIFLVVLGHSVGAACHYASGGVYAALTFAYKVIYLFHMPAFFFVSGLLWKPRQGGFAAFLKKRFVRLIVPYFAWGVLSVLLYLAVSAAPALLQSGSTDTYYHDGMFKFPVWQPFVSLLHAGGWPHGEGFRANSVLWFLPCLFVVQLAGYVLDRLRLGKRALLVAMVLFFGLGAAVRICHWGGLPWGLSLAPRYFAFFLLGTIIAPHLSKLTTSHTPLTTRHSSLATSLALYLVLASFLPNMYMANVSWLWYAVELAFAVGGLLLALSLARVLPFGPLWVRLGRDSLGIMLSHKFMVLALVALGVRLRFPGVAAVVAAVGATAGAVLVTNGVRRIAPRLLGE